MKVTAVNLYLNNMNFKQEQVNNISETENRKSGQSLPIIIGTAAALGIAAGVIYKFTKSKTGASNALSKTAETYKYELTNRDKAFYDKIIIALKKAGIDANIDSVRSIVPPDEFKYLVKKFKPEHFRAGLQVSESKAAGMSLDEFYKNAIDGNFRVSLHTHSNYSDGKATPQEFLECATKYADKVAAMNKNDGLPPFTIALTDHDCVDGCMEIIRLIGKNPEKYKNLRFVSGCEYSVRDGNKHHDITGLALNPFEFDLYKPLLDLSEKRRRVILKFLDSQPEFNGKKITLSDLIEYEKQHYAKHGKDGKHCIENGSGIVSVRHAIKFFYKLTNQDVDKNMVNELGDKEIPSIESVIQSIKTNGGYASLTHPVKSFWQYIGDAELTRLKNMGVDGIEVNHQYTPSKITKLGKINNDVEKSDNLFEEITEKYKQFAEKNDMFLSGGTDCHEKQIFSREPKITKEFLENKLLK